SRDRPRSRRLSVAIKRSIIRPYLHVFFLNYPHSHRALSSFPTRRSSDLQQPADRSGHVQDEEGGRHRPRASAKNVLNRRDRRNPDRKSTRLNSSHVKISYAVFCLKKKKHIIKIQRQQTISILSIRPEMYA